MSETNFYCSVHDRALDGRIAYCDFLFFLDKNSRKNSKAIEYVVYQLALTSGQDNCTRLTKKDIQSLLGVTSQSYGEISKKVERLFKKWKEVYYVNA